jgi:hypothetical protein
MKHRFRFLITIALYFYDGQSPPVGAPYHLVLDPLFKNILTLGLYPTQNAHDWNKRSWPPSCTVKFHTITPRQRNLEELISKRTSSEKTSPFCFLFCNHGYNAIIVQLSKSQCINFVCGKELERQLSPLHLNWTNYFNNR